MGDGFPFDGDFALQKTRRRSHKQALFGTTRLGLLLRGDDTDRRSVALLQVGLTLALGAVQRGGGGGLGGFLKLRWPLM
jgi:hypothetical protein